MRTMLMTLILLALLIFALWSWVNYRGNDCTGSCPVPGAEEGKEMEYNELTPDEARVMIDKGTETPFTGKYWNYHEDGTYTCKRCDAPLFNAEAKFDSGTGWPSFDEAIPGAVEQIPDADGYRTEIVCANCGAHLGHVFFGEGMTDKNTRHCVNSISMNFEPERAEETAIFAGGCFWGVEYRFQNLDGVISTTVGYTGGHTDNPTYNEVCGGKTGHAEAVEVVFDPGVISYEELARFFFETHDPTQVNRQGVDYGEQYRSAIFYTSEEQKQVAESLIEKLEANGYKVATQVEPAGDFWPAEEYHQDYFSKKDYQPSCGFCAERFGG
ncbi:MAG: bifunctional methionine sulfoxide reductase B/A protein [Dehalococcoidia bacterium]